MKQRSIWLTLILCAAILVNPAVPKAQAGTDTPAVSTPAAEAVGNLTATSIGSSIYEVTPAPETVYQKPVVPAPPSGNATSPDPLVVKPVPRVKTAHKITRSGSTLIYDNRAMEIIQFRTGPAGFYAKVINRFAAACGPEVRVYSLLAPTAFEFLDDPDYQGLAAPQRDTIDYVNSCFDPGVIPIDAYGKLAAHLNEYVFFRSDHHWTALGAYYAYQAFMEARGEIPVPLSKYRPEKMNGYLGYFYWITKNTRLAKTPDTITYYAPLVPAKMEVNTGKGWRTNSIINRQFSASRRKYCVFLGSDWALARIKTGNPNGKKIMVEKDSFGNPFAIFLIPHYQEIYLVDTRHFKGNLLDVVKQNGIQEVLFLHYMLIPAANDIPWAIHIRF
ncbi:MAG: DHHW family protein [Solirubrobacterales bacterium]